MDSRYELLDDFRNTWTLSRLKDMKLDDYTNLNASDSFCFWLESKTSELGSIWGGSAYKFQIYRCRTAPKLRTGQQSDGKYAWNSKHGDDPDEVFEIVKAAVCDIAEKAASGEFEKIDKINVFGEVCKWKIAFLYSARSKKTDNRLIPIYNRKMLEAVAKKQGIKNCEDMWTSEIHRELIKKRGICNLFEYYRDLFEYYDELINSISYSKEVRSCAAAEQQEPSAHWRAWYGQDIRCQKDRRADGGCYVGTGAVSPVIRLYRLCGGSASCGYWRWYRI